MANDDACGVCGHQQAVVVGRSDLNNRTTFDCPRCGRFTIGRMAMRRLLRERGTSPEMSAWIRDHQELDRAVPIILQHNIDEILSSLPEGERVADKQRLLLTAIRRRASTLGETVRLTIEDDYPVGHARNGADLLYLLRNLEEEGLVRLAETTDWVDCEVTPQGWDGPGEPRSVKVEGELHRADDELPRPRNGRAMVDVTRHCFEVALSFPGERRSYVERVAQ